MDGYGGVVAKRTIQQSPLTDAPDVPLGARGHLEDEDEPWLFVDFGEPYGVVLCERGDVQ